MSRRTIEGIAKAGDAVWQSNRSVGENVKTIGKVKTAKTAKKAASKRPRSRKKAKKRTSEIARPARREPTCCARSRRAPQRQRPPRLRAAATRDAARQAAERRELGARGEVRRLSHAGAAGGRQGQAAHPQGARLGAQVQAGRGRGRAARCRYRADRRRGRGRGERRQRFLGAAGRAQARQSRTSSITCSI